MSALRCFITSKAKLIKKPELARFIVLPMGNQASAGRPPQVSPEHLRPSPKVSQRAEFDERALRRAILERRLAPCTRVRAPLYITPPARPASPVCHLHSRCAARAGPG